jgi:serine/threonine-protein kinase
MSAPAESRVVGRYALYGEIASGGMASVHIGRLLGPVGFSRTVAIKRLHPSYARDPEFVSMFLDEARLAARIRHPNVVPTLDVVATHGELFLVMEYIQGESLSPLIRTLGRTKARVPIRVALSIVAGALQGLHAAHEARDERGMSLGLVHRDVSPQNIIVGVDGMARVFDFGVAKAAGRAHNTRDGVVKGKLAYMAPEQLSQEHVDRAADIYAASIVLWELLTGSRLFRADSEGALLVLVLQRDIQPPSTIVPGLSAELDAIVMRGLAPAPADRFPTAREMALALDRLGSASLSEVAEWLESVAGPALARRADQVSAVEQQSPSYGGGALLPVPGPDEANPEGRIGALQAEEPWGPSSVGSDRPAPASASGSIAVTRPEAVPEPRRRPLRTPVLAALLVVAALGGATVAVSVVRGQAAPSASPARSGDTSASPLPTPAPPSATAVPASAATSSAGGAMTGPTPAVSSTASSAARVKGPMPAPTTHKSPFDLGGRD